MKPRETHWEKREGQTERWKDGLDTENGMERKRGGNTESGGDPVPSLPVCVWGGAAVESTVARGSGEGRLCEINMHL